MKETLTITNRRQWAILFWVLSVLCMGLIFWFSSRTADESMSQSDGMVAWLRFLIPNETVRILLVRKSAHCMEFAGLGMLFNAAWYFTRQNKSYLPAILCTSLYAVTDEVHQLFVEGRSCELTDWGIDTFGGILGTVAFVVLFRIITGILKKKHKKPIKLEEDI